MYMPDVASSGTSHVAVTDQPVHDVAPCEFAIVAAPGWVRGVFVIWSISRKPTPPYQPARKMRMIVDPPVTQNSTVSPTFTEI